MEDKKVDLVNALRCLENDYQNLGVEIEFLEKEIHSRWNGEINTDNIKKIIEGLGLWVEGVEKCIDGVEEGIEIYQRKRILNKLEEKN